MTLLVALQIISTVQLAHAHSSVPGRSLSAFCCSFSPTPVHCLILICLLDLSRSALGRLWHNIVYPSVAVCPSSSVTDVMWLNGSLSRTESAIVPSDRALATSYRLSIVTMSPSAAVWPQFSMAGFKL